MLFVGSLLQVTVDKTSRKQHSVSGTQFSQIRDLSNISTVTTVGIPSTHTSASQSSQSIEPENPLVNSLPVSNTAEGQAALDSMPAVQHHEAVSAAAAHQNALHERTAHGHRPEEQGSKTGTEQPRALVPLQPGGTRNNVTSKSTLQPSVALQPVVKPPPANRDDLVIVMPSSIDRMPIVAASRGWRQGVRTYIAFEDEVDLKNASSIFTVCTNAFQAVMQPTQFITNSCYSVIVQLSWACWLCSLHTALALFMTDLSDKLDSSSWNVHNPTCLLVSESVVLLQKGVTHHNEVYGVCPDQYVSDPKWHKAGDLRATVTPFIANMTIGPDNFKWMLFGDDDTVFLIDNVLNLLPHLDPVVPYFMTDHLWYPDTVGKHAHAVPCMC